MPRIKRAKRRPAFNAPDLHCTAQPAHLLFRPLPVQLQPHLVVFRRLLGGADEAGLRARVNGGDVAGTKVGWRKFHTWVPFAFVNEAGLDAGRSTGGEAQRESCVCIRAPATARLAPAAAVAAAAAAAAATHQLSLVVHIFVLVLAASAALHVTAQRTTSGVQKHSIHHCVVRGARPRPAARFWCVSHARMMSSTLQQQCRNPAVNPT